MKVLSLFDGMACGMIAMKNAGIEVENYDAYEIDEYAIKVAQHNFPAINQHGDVFKEDFTKYEGVDYLIGGSPCTYWSIAQKNNRETEASGMGWELFSQYVRAIKEAKPKFFVYENNKSMSKAIRASIDEAFGFEAVCINSALVSAQNRQRLYWVGMRNEDGTYSKVSVEQPKNKCILLKDVMDVGVVCQDKPFIQCDTSVSETVRVGCYGKGGQGERMYSVFGKSVCIGTGGALSEKYCYPINDAGCITENFGDVYEVKNGFVTIKGNVCHVKLEDGLYIIRKLILREFARLQTVPEWYDFSVISNSQAHKCLGNGWTCDVITHLINATREAIK